MGYLVEFKNVFFNYLTGSLKPVEALKGINLQVDHGDFLAIIGPNGSGKSTLAKHFNGLLAPASGEVVVCGISTSNRNQEQLKEIRKKVGLVFQNPDNQLVSSIVEEDLAFGPENLGLPQPEIRKRVNRALAALNLRPYRRESICQLTEGQKQLVAIAGVLAMKPDCIVLDEPTALLDPLGRRQLLENLRKLNREEGIAIVFITHSMREAAHFKRVAVMGQGKIKMDGSPEEIFSQGNLIQEAGLEMPVVAALAGELARRGFAVPPGILHAEELVASLCRLKSNI